jgi:hypothetical protein
MNCLILLLLLFCCGNNNNGSETGGCGRAGNRERDDDCGCRMERSEPRPEPRQFMPFQGQGTCGCEGAQNNE